MYRSNSIQTITEDPQKTSCPGIVEFINDTCKFYPSCETIAEEVYDKYVQYCKDRHIAYSTFNVFARSFKYYAFHNNMVPDIQIHRVNYTHYKDGVGYIRKSGWAYSNLCVVEKPITLIEPLIYDNPQISDPLQNNEKLITPSFIKEW